MVSSRVRSALLAGLLFGGLARAQSRPVPELGDYAVLGLGDVTIRAGSRVASGAVGAIGGTVRLGPETHAGTVFCHFVNGPPTLPTCNAFVRCPCSSRGGGPTCPLRSSRPAATCSSVHAAPTAAPWSGTRSSWVPRRRCGSTARSEA